MVFCQVWIVRRASTSNLTKSQTFPVEKPCGSKSGLRFSFVFWISLYKDYPGYGQNSQGIPKKAREGGINFIHSANMGSNISTLKIFR